MIARFSAVILLLVLASCGYEKDTFEVMKTADVEDRVYKVYDIKLDSFYTDTLLVGFVDDVAFGKKEMPNKNYWFEGYKTHADSLFFIRFIHEVETDSVIRLDQYYKRFELKTYVLGSTAVDIYKIPDYGWGAKGMNLRPKRAEFESREFGYLGSVSRDRISKVLPQDGRTDLIKLVEVLEKDSTFYNWKFPDRFIVNKIPRE